MSDQPFDTAQLKAEQRRSWDESAAGWNRSWEMFERAAQHVSDRLIELARIKPGQRVLDVATGNGEPALTVARRIGPLGHVVATDHSAGMLKFARERAAAAGLSNIEFLQMDAEALDLPENSFDAILSRWGLMFLPDLAGALARMRKLLVPGGRLAASVWSSAPKVPMIGLVEGVRKQFGLLPQRPGMLGPLSLADIPALERTLTQAGFSEVASESIPVTFEFASPDEYVRFQQEIRNPASRLIAEQPAETQAKIWKAVTDAVRAYAGADGVVRLPNECFCLTARR